MKTVKSYYRVHGTRLGFKFLLKGIRHFGYYPAGEPVNHAQAQIAMMDLIAKKLALKPGSKVLDAGCGEGETALRLARSYEFTMSGIDLLPESIRIARNKSGVQKAGVDFAVGSYDKLPFPANSFDGLYAQESFIHARNPEAVLKEFKRVLKPGGRLVITDYTSTPEDELPEKYQRLQQWTAHGSASPGLLIIHHDYYQKTLAGLGYHHVSVTDITADIMPMLRWFRRLAFVPFQLIRLAGQQAKHPNTLMAYYGVKVAREKWWRCVLVQATK